MVRWNNDATGKLDNGTVTMVARFTQENEWNWRTGRPPLADW